MSRLVLTQLSGKGICIVSQAKLTVTSGIIAQVLFEIPVLSMGLLIPAFSLLDQFVFSTMWMEPLVCWFHFSHSRT